MAEEGFAPTPDQGVNNPIKSFQDYQSVSAQLQQNPGHPKAAKVRSALNFFKQTNPQLFQGVPEGIGPGTPLARAQGQADIQSLQEQGETSAKNQAAKQGYDIDLSRPENLGVIQTIAGDPKQIELLKKVREATQDPKLPNASKLKVFDDPPDYRPPANPNPFSALPEAPKDTQYFYEPSLEEFKAAVKSGALATQLKREFPNIPDPLKLIDSNLEGSKTFQAYQDASWKHALADAIKNKTPISRVEYSTALGPIEKAQATGLDYATSGATAAGLGASMGLSDPLLRSVAPETAEAERRSRMRHPNVALGGEIAGSLSPTGLVGLTAKGVAKGLGKFGLESKGVQGVVKGLGSAATTGAVDANIRAIAQSAADALDAGDSAVEAAKHVYASLSPQAMLQRGLEGGGAGLALGAAGEGLGSVLGKGARAIVGGNPKETLLHGQASGLKMGALGEPVIPKDLETLAGEAAAQGKNAEDVIAQKVSGPLSRQRLLEQETQHRTAVEDTAKAREALTIPAETEPGVTTSVRAKPTEMTVPTDTAAQRIEELANKAGTLTRQGEAGANELKSIARKLRSKGRLTAAQMDAEIDAMEQAAKSDSKNPDPNLLAVKRILLDTRDEFKFPEDQTIVDNYAIRDPEGNVKAVESYSALKAQQARDKGIYQTQNAAMGLPVELKPAAQKVPKAPDAEASQALAESLPPEVKFKPNEREAFEGRIASSGDPANAVRLEHYRDLAARAGLKPEGEALKNLSRLRSAQNWKQYLGRAISGIGTGGSTYVRANNLLRVVPALKSLSGGLPDIEASPQAVDVVDRFIANAVPEWKWANLRGGQAARPAETIRGRKKEAKIADTMTDEEANFAITVIRAIQAMGDK